MPVLDAPQAPAFLPLTDDELVAHLRSGDAETALRGIQDRYGRRLFHFLKGMVRDPHQAQDLVQDVLQKVLSRHALYEPGTNFRAWLFEIARNQALTSLRSQRRLPRPLSSLPLRDGEDTHDLLHSVADSSEDRSCEERELMGALAEAVAALPPHYRTVFELCVQRGLPYQEAGRRLGLPTGTVAIRIMRARKRLFAALQEHLGRLRRPPACFQ